MRWWIFIVITVCLKAQPGAYTIDTIAGTDAVVEGGAAATAIFSQNEGLAVDSQGNLYVSDAGGNRVRKITPDGAIRTIASTGLNQPYGITVDRTGQVYIADLGNACVRRLNLDGTLSVVVSQGLAAPRNVALDVDGSLLISDFGRHQVLRYASSGSLSVVAGTGKAGFSGDGGLAASAQLNAPAGLAVDSAGALYIADSGNNRIRKIVHGVISTVMAVGGPVGVSAGLAGAVYVAGANYLGTLTAAAGTFGGVQDVALDAAGNVFYITLRQVEKIGARGLLSVVAGSGADPRYGGDGGPATAARLNGPAALALDVAGNLYIADALNNRIRRVSPVGLMETVAGSGDASLLNGPSALAFDAQNNLYIADTGNGRVRKLSAGGVLTTAVDGLNGPLALAMDSVGALYIAEPGRVLKVAGASVSTAATVDQPVGLAFDTDGSLLIVTAGSILKMTSAGVLVSVAEGAGVRALAVTSSGAYLTAAANQVWVGSAAIAGADGVLNMPSALAVDTGGAIYVADRGNNRVRRLTPVPLAALTVVNAASMLAGPIASNEIVSLFGANFPATPDVRFNGVSAAVFYAGSAQINALAPVLTGPSVVVLVTGAAAATVPVAAAAPGLFSVVIDADGTVNSPANPAIRGSVITMYATGLGADLSSLMFTIGGYGAEILYAGGAPGFLGLQQINARIPGGFLPAGDLAVVVNVAGASAGTVVSVR